jgi:hypothetical protein
LEYLGGRDPEDNGSNSAQGKLFVRPYLENTHHKKISLEERLKW